MCNWPRAGGSPPAAMHAQRLPRMRFLQPLTALSYRSVGHTFHTAGKVSKAALASKRVQLARPPAPAPPQILETTKRQHLPGSSFHEHCCIQRAPHCRLLALGCRALNLHTGAMPIPVLQSGHGYTTRSKQHA